MNKLFKSIVAASVGVAMAIGVGVGASREASAVYAEDKLEYTLNGTVTASGNAYATASTVTQSDIGWKVVGNTEQSPWRIGGKSITNQDREIYSTTALDANISKIEVTSGATVSSLTVNSLTITVHSTASDAQNGTNALATKSVTSGIASSTVIFEKADSTSWAGKYYRFVYNVTRTSSSGNGYITFENAKLYSTVGSTTYSVSYNANATANVDGDVPTSHTGLSNGATQNLSNTGPTRWGYDFGGWAATPESTAPITSVTINGASVTVYAIWNADLTVTGAHASNPYTVAQAKDAIDVGEHLNENYVEGKISQIDSYNSSYKSITYWISEDGSTNDQFEVYSGKGLNGADFSSIDDIEIGATVLVFGTIKEYESVYEFGANSQMISYDAPVSTLEKLEKPQPSYSDNTISWSAVPHASSYDLSIDDGAAIHDVTSPYTLSGLVALSIHTVKVTAIGDNVAYSDSNPGSVTFAKLEQAGTSEDPYTVASARAAIDGGYEAQTQDVYVAGTVSQIVSAYNSQYGNISYNLSDDGSTSSAQLQAFRGKSYNGENFTDANDIMVNDRVVVHGNLTKYNSTYEFEAGNDLFSLERPLSLVSIAVSGDYQTEFEIGDEFNHDGAVVTATYSDDSTDDVTDSAVFSEPDMSTAGNKTITITYSENDVPKTATYNITVSDPNSVLVELDYNALVAGGITIGTSGSAQRFEKDGLVITISSGVANSSQSDVRVYSGETITFAAPSNIRSIEFTCNGSGYNTTKFEDADGLDKTNGVWTGSATSVSFKASSQVRIKNLVIIYDKPSSSAEIENSVTYAKLSYNYVKSGDGIIDVLNKDALNISGQSYVDWNNITSNSGIVFAGNSAGNANNIQLKSKDNISGIVVTSNDTGKTATVITIQWNPNTTPDSVLDIYGRTSEQDAYEGPSDLYGSDVAFDSLTYDGEQRIQKLEISGNYRFIGLRSNSGSLYIDSISIQWGTVSYSYDDVAIRLGGEVDKDVWDELNGTTNNIEGYGVLLSNKDYLGNTELKTLYGSANSDNFKTFDMALTTKAPVDGGDYYYWNLYKRVTDYLTTDYVAVAYIRTKTGVVFLQQVTASAKSLANDMINDPLHDVGSFEGSLANLALK